MGFRPTRRGEVALWLLRLCQPPGWVRSLLPHGRDVACMPRPRAFPLTRPNTLRRSDSKQAQVFRLQSRARSSAGAGRLAPRLLTGGVPPLHAIAPSVSQDKAPYVHDPCESETWTRSGHVRRFTM